MQENELKYKLIPNIYPGQSEWIAKVNVAEKSAPKIAWNGASKYLKMALIDSEVCSSLQLHYNLPTTYVLRVKCYYSILSSI